MGYAHIPQIQEVLRGAWRDDPDCLAALAGHDETQDAILYLPMTPKISVSDTGID